LITTKLNREYLNFETAIYEKNNALNELSSVIYNIPHAEVVKYKDSIKVLQSLLTTHLYNISQILKNKNKLTPITVNTMPDDSYDTNFIIKDDDTHTKGYMSVFNLY
jgi:hypothetical protein